MNELQKWGKERKKTGQTKQQLSKKNGKIKE